jgi:hypothetical protein
MPYAATHKLTGLGQSGMIRHDGLAFIGLTLIAFSIAVFYAVREGVTANSIIYVSGAISSIVIALLAMWFDARHREVRGQARDIGDPDGLKDFILKRGILFALVQAPILAFFAGFFFRWTTYTVAVFIVLISFMILPAWVSYRKSVSTDPDEPVHHLGLYLICACSAAAAFSLLRIVLHFVWGYIYWSPWFSFGGELSGLEPNTFGALAAGAVLYTIHGITLGLAYFILFKRHTLLNAILLLTFYLASLYSLLFPMLGRFGQTTDWIFHATNWSAHLCVALGSWYSLKFWKENSHKLVGGRRVVVASLPVMLAIVPVVFAFYRTTTWIEPTQTAIDREVFGRNGLVRVNDNSMLLVSGVDDAHLQFNIQIGPRTYENYNRKQKSLDARRITISGRVFEGDAIVAWCVGHVESLASPNRIKSSNAEYFAGIERMNFTEIPVDCVGSAQLLKNPESRALKVEWSMEATLVADWSQKQQKFRGVNSFRIAPGVSAERNQMPATCNTEHVDQCGQRL